MPNEPVNESARRLDRTIIAASERCQRNIAEAVHDTLCQTLGGASLLLSVVEGDLLAGRLPEAAHVERLREMLDGALDEARQVFTQLQPVPPGREGLMIALARLATETSARTPCEFECEDAVLIDDPEVAITLYRIADEAVQNAVVHGGARQIKVVLSNRDDVNALTITDNGRGFNPYSPGGKVGGPELMKARAQAVGGTVTSESTPGHGTTVRFSLPKGGESGG